MVGAFLSPDQSKIILQLFNEGQDQDFSIDVPIGATNISHYVTSDTESDNYSLYEDVSFELGSRYTNLSIPSMSLHTLVYTIDSSVLATNTIEISNAFENLITLYPNPTDENTTLKFHEDDQYSITLYYSDGRKIYETQIKNKKTYDLKTSELSSGIYFIKIQSKTKSSDTVVKFIKKWKNEKNINMRIYNIIISYYFFG